MSDFIEVFKKADLQDGTMKKVDVKGHEILVARSGDRFFCVDNRCPHLGGDLSKGTLKGSVVTCPIHKSQFDLSDGRVIQWTNFTGLVSTIGKMFKTPRSLITHEIKVEGDQVLARFD
jgi:3-phenylpropionate/trans-cinnamate dioxygenase ferredoxin component